MTDEFAKFGGKATEPEQDEFARFGGKSTPKATEDEFSKFGGRETGPAELPPTAAPSASVRAAEAGSDSASAAELGGTPDSDSRSRTQPESRSWGLGASKEALTADNMRAIAEKFGVDPSDLRSLAPWFGVKMEPEMKGVAGLPEALKLGGKAVAATIGSNVALGIPQFVLKKAQDEKMRAALDYVREMGSEQRSYPEAVSAALASPLAGVVKGTAGIIPKLAEMGAMGGVGGVAGSEEGKEVKSGLIGTAAGVGLGLLAHGAVAGVGKLLDRKAEKALSKAETAGEQAVEEVAVRSGADFQHGVAAAVAEKEQADAHIIDHVLHAEEGAPLSEEAVSEINRVYQPGQAEKLAGDPEFASRYKGLSPDDILARAEKEVAETVVDNSVDAMTREVFGKKVSEKDDPIGSLRKWAGLGVDEDGRAISGQGGQYARDRLQGVLNFRTAADYLTERGISQKNAPSWLSQQVDKVMAEQYVLRSLDEKWKGLGAEDALKDIGWGLNRMSFAKTSMLQSIEDIYRSHLRNKMDDAARDSSLIQEKLESGRALTQEEEQVARPFLDYFKNSRERLAKLAKEDGLPPLYIAEVENYLPHTLKDPRDLRNTMIQRVGAILKDASVLSGERYSELAQVPDDVLRAAVRESSEHLSTLRFMHTLSGDSGNRPAELQHIFNSTFLNREGGDRLGTIAKAALERKGDIPIWARETDLYKLADKWTNNTLRHLYLRNGLDKLRTSARLLKRLKAETDAEHVERLIADLSGVRKNTANEYFSRYQDSFHNWMDQRIERASGPTKVLLTEVKALPSFLQTAAGNVYANVLGANPKAIIMNATQPFTKTLPELGIPYGTSIFMRGAMRMGGVRNLPASVRRLEAMGLAPAGHVGSFGYKAEGLARTRGGQLAGTAGETSKKLGSFLYSKVEQANRAITLSAADMMAADLAGGSQLAEAGLSRFPTSVRRAVAEARAAGDQEAVVKELATHLINSTQYQYNPAHMSEFGRTMGPLFSAFTTWPSQTLGHVVEQYRTKGLSGGTRRLAETMVAPWLLLELGDTLMGQHTEEGLSDRQKSLLGRSGLSQSAPIGNIGAIASGNFFTPPAVDTAFKLLVNPAQEKDTDRALSSMKRAASNGVYMFAPAGIGGWIRFLTDDAVTMATGERPEGTDFFERTASGAETINKGK